MTGSVVVLVFCAKFVVIERRENIMEFRAAMGVVDFLNEAFEGEKIFSLSL